MTTDPIETEPTYPETYLHVQRMADGQEWIVPIGDNDPIALRTNLESWVKSEFGGELEIDGVIMPKLDGEYYGRIMTDGRAPSSPICWQGGGFYLKTV